MKDPLQALSDWVNEDVWRRAIISPHVSGCRITLEDGFATVASREGEPGDAADRAVAAANKPSTIKHLLEVKLTEAKRQAFQSKVELDGRVSAVNALQKELEQLEERGRQ